MLFVLDFIYNQVYHYLYSALDLFLPQKKFLVLSFDSSSQTYSEIIQCLKLAFNNQTSYSYSDDPRDQILNDTGYCVEFKNFYVSQAQVSSYYYSKDDLYRYTMKGCSAYIVIVDCERGYGLNRGAFSALKVDDLIGYSKVDDYQYSEKNPFVYTHKNHRPMLFLLCGKNTSINKRAEELIEEGISNWEYEKDKFYIAYYNSDVGKESLYEGMEWILSKQSA